MPRLQSRLGGSDRMRLVITAGPPDIWFGLEPETGEIAMASEECAARGEWTNGHGADAIVRLPGVGDAARLPGHFR
jgi:hypothetical protein